MADQNEIRQQVDEAQREYNRALEEIRMDTTLSDVGRAQRIEALYVQQRTRIGRLRDQLAAAVAAERSALAAAAFGVGFPANATAADKAVIRSDYRQALDRAEQAGSSDDSQTLLRRALLTGDAILARAVAATAYMRGQSDVLSSYGDAFPDAMPNIERLAAMDGAVGDRAGRLLNSMRFSVPTPPELGVRNLALPTAAG
jgi:hypothetical protein